MRSSDALPCSIALPPAEEAYSAYDHPTVYVFRKTEQYRDQGSVASPEIADQCRPVRDAPRSHQHRQRGSRIVGLPHPASGQSRKQAVPGRSSSIGMRRRIASRLGIVLWATHGLSAGWMAYPWLSACYRICDWVATGWPGSWGCQHGPIALGCWQARTRSTYARVPVAAGDDGRSHSA